MKSISLAVFFLFFTSIIFGTEIIYPTEPLRNDPVEAGQSLYPGTQGSPLASENTVVIDYKSGESIADPDSAFGGITLDGTCEKNKLTFKNGHVVRFVLGGFSLKGNVQKNSVLFAGGIAADAAIGKVCGGQTQNGDVNENSVTITGGQIVGDVYGGDANTDGNAHGNSIEISGGELQGFVNGGGVSGIGTAKKNRIVISGGTIGMGLSGGFAHFAAGLPPQPTEKEKEKTNSSLENSVKISGKTEINGNVSGGFILDSDGSADKNNLEISGGTIRGNIYGGRAYNGNANGNVVVISGGTIKDKDETVYKSVYAGYVHEPENGSQAAGNTVTISGMPELATVTIHGNNLPTWKTDENTLNFKGFRGSVYGISHFQNVNIDKDSEITVLGGEKIEAVNLSNEGRVVFKNE